MKDGNPIIDEDAIYRQLGKYIVCFQWLENEIVQIASFLLDPNHTGRARAVLTGMNFRKLTKLADVLFSHFIAEARIENADERKQQFHELMTRCDMIGKRRNCLVYSTYVHLESGDQLFGIMRSKGALRTGGKDGPRHEFDQEDISPETFEEPLREIAEVGFSIKQVYVQLTHWHGRIIRPDSTA